MKERNTWSEKHAGQSRRHLYRLWVRLRLPFALIALSSCTSIPMTEFKPLFNGKDISGWKPHERFSSATWNVTDGVLVGSVGEGESGGYLSTGTAYSGFILDFEVQFDWLSQSSVLLRSDALGKGHEILFNYRPDGEVGALNCPWTQGVAAHVPLKYKCGSTPDSVPHVRYDDWNQIRIIVEGDPPLIKFWINDACITDFQHTEASAKGIPAEGAICFGIKKGFEGAQNASIKLRNIRLRELPSVP